MAKGTPICVCDGPSSNTEGVGDASVFKSAGAWIGYRDDDEEVGDATSGRTVWKPSLKSYQDMDTYSELEERFVRWNEGKGEPHGMLGGPFPTEFGRNWQPARKIACPTCFETKPTAHHTIEMKRFGTRFVWTLPFNDTKTSETLFCIVGTGVKSTNITFNTSNGPQKIRPCHYFFFGRNAYSNDIYAMTAPVDPLPAAEEVVAPANKKRTRGAGSTAPAKRARKSAPVKREPSSERKRRGSDTIVAPTTRRRRVTLHFGRPGSDFDSEPEELEEQEQASRNDASMEPSALPSDEETEPPRGRSRRVQQEEVANTDDEVSRPAPQRPQRTRRATQASVAPPSAPPVPPKDDSVPKDADWVLSEQQMRDTELKLIASNSQGDRYLAWINLLGCSTVTDFFLRIKNAFHMQNTVQCVDLNIAGSKDFLVVKDDTLTYQKFLEQRCDLPGKCIIEAKVKCGGRQL